MSARPLSAETGLDPRAFEDAGEPRRSVLIEGTAPNDEPCVSVVFGRTFRIEPDGALEPTDDYRVVEDVRLEPARTASRYTRPSLLTRDIDAWVWKSATDLVIRGTARAPRAVPRLDVALRVTKGAELEMDLVVTGDRWVDRGKAGLVLSEPVPFDAMPLTLDRAYGGTDDAAEAREGDESLLNLVLKHFSPAEAAELSLFSYPRNAAGKGYLVDVRDARGLAWPNVELANDRLALASVARPNLDWGDRPIPASFDWVSYASFPRSAHVCDLPPIAGDRVPMREKRLGLFADGWEETPPAERPTHPFAQGAHPLLSRTRFTGGEAIHVSAIGPEGRDLELSLPRLRPEVSLDLLGEARVTVPAVLDLVLVEADRMELTLVYRATHLVATHAPKSVHFFPGPPAENGEPRGRVVYWPLDWEARSPYAIRW
ncbi:MAG: DUF2169 domain-containing protein [Polyangiaceae bacterium]